MDCDDGPSPKEEAGGVVARKPGYVSSSVVRGAMLRHNLTGLQVATRVGVNPSTVRNWLAGRTAPPPAKLAALAQVLDLNVRDLTGILPARETLADMRIHAALSQAQAASQAGLSQSAFSTIEQGAGALSDGLCAALAGIYGTSGEDVRAAWQRANDTLKGSTR